MAVYKRYKGARVTNNHPDYNKATWVAQGMVEGERYHTALKAKTKTEAKIAEADIINKITSGEFSYLKDKTKFSQFVDEKYLPHAKTENDNYKTKVIEVNHLKDYFGDRLLRNVTAGQCEEYKKWRKAQFVPCQKCRFNKVHICTPKPISSSTVNREMSTLSAIFSLAIIYNKRKDNPIHHIKRMQEPPGRTRFLTDAEKPKLLAEVAIDDQLNSIVIIALMTGWRKGQILKLKRTDLLHDLKAVNVSKSKKSPPMTVAVNSYAWNVLTELALYADFEYLFWNARSERYLGNFDKRWLAALSRAGITDFQFKDLRRTFATDMLRLGAQGLEIQSALGHSDQKMTAIYARVINSNLRDSLEKLVKVEGVM